MTSQKPALPTANADPLSSAMCAELGHIFNNNRDWASKMVAGDPNFFSKLSHVQSPQFLWIGCSDSRVPANEIIGLAPGEVFVHRNVANLISLTDFNCLSVVQYAVQVLKVRHIIVCGHYGCGGVAASLTSNEIGLVTNWLSPLTEIYDVHESRLKNIGDRKLLEDKMCELSVATQVRNLCRSAIVRRAWKEKQPLAIHGMIYGLHDGILHDLGVNAVDHDESERSITAALERIVSHPARMTA